MPETIIPYLFQICTFLSLFFALKEKEKYEKKEKKSGCFLCPDGHWDKLYWSSTARPVNRLSFAHYRCLRSTFAAHPALNHHPPPVGESKSLISVRGKVIVCGATSKTRFLPYIYPQCNTICIKLHSRTLRQAGRPKSYPVVFRQNACRPYVYVRSTTICIELYSCTLRNKVG